jgi:hypothetical protein
MISVAESCAHAAGGRAVAFGRRRGLRDIGVACGALAMGAVGNGVDAAGVTGSL